MARLWQYVQRYQRRLIWGSLMLLGTNVITMAIPQFFRFAVDGLNVQAPAEDLMRLAAVLAVVAIVGAVLRTLSRIHIFYVGSRY